MSEPSSPRPLIAWTALAIGAAIAAALLLLALNGAPAAPFKPVGPVGSIQAVTLVNGQIYFGTLKSEDATKIVLADVFDLATNLNQETNERSTQLIRRMTGSVYGATDLAVPIDKILFTETVGKDSTVAKAMINMESTPPVAPATVR